jgi:hypothetical protein
MPKSRKRKKPRANARITSRDPLAVERMFDLVGRGNYASGPKVLYHYTNWAAARGILSSQEFWATDHRCTNDPAELASADKVIVEIASSLREEVMGMAATVLDSFLAEHLTLRVSQLMTVCLLCFSVLRDDKGQWEKYGQNGCGVCLGLRVLDEPGPIGPSATLKVDYSEESWRENIRVVFRNICSMLSSAANTAHNRELGKSALTRIAAFQAITAKDARWQVEQEFRHVTLVRSQDMGKLRQRGSPGNAVSYLPVLVRSKGKRIALAELIIGPNCKPEEARENVKQLLQDTGYEPGTIEYPVIAISPSPGLGSGLG